MRGGCQRSAAAATVALLALAALPASAQDAPRPGPAKPRYQGIAWERDLEAGLSRAAAEGRPVYVAVNALLDDGETGNVLCANGYRSKELGDAARDFVCLVANPNAHEPAADGTCSRYGAGTCDAHRAAMDWAMRRFSRDGASLTSPSHFVLGPDGETLYAAEFMQGALTAAQLDAHLVATSPRLALRAVWSVREQRMDALGKSKPADLGKVASEWIATKDPWAASGVVAAAEQETDAARRRALLAAIGSAGGAALPAVWDAVDGVASDPDVDPGATHAWIVAVLEADERFGGWAAARAIHRTRNVDLAASLVLAAAFSPDRPGGRDAGVGASLAEALFFAREDFAERLRAARGGTPLPPRAELLAAYEKEAAAAGWPAARITWTLTQAGKPPPLDLSGDRESKRRSLALAAAADVVAKKDAVKALLADPATDLRVAAALALRRAGDSSGADVLLAVIADPVEGVEVRWALARIAGEDLGDAPAAWEDVVRGGGK